MGLEERLAFLWGQWHLQFRFSSNEPWTTKGTYSTLETALQYLPPGLTVELRIGRAH